MTSRTLAQWLSYLEQLHPSEIELGLERIRTVAERLQLLEPAARVVTVTGTNGKGSTCAYIAQLLIGQGLHVGLYSSPHFLHYNERIRIDGQMVSDEHLCVAFAEIEQARGDISLTYFEYGTLAALWIFSQQKLDVLILEVGLGGRLDAVNIVEPDVAVVTSIAVDHIDWLGDSRELVAREKAGIFRCGVPAVCGDLQPPASLLEQARQIQATLILRGRDFDFSLTDSGWQWHGSTAQGEELALQGALPSLPLESAALALQVYALLGLPWQAQCLDQDLQATRLAGRLQVVQRAGKKQSCPLILDVAHNPHAAQYLARWLEKRPLQGKRLAVFGALSDKDVQGVVAALKPSFSSWAIAPLPSPRSCTVAELEQVLTVGKVSFSVHPDIEQALQAQNAVASSQDEIVVFGSFFTVAQVLELLEAEVMSEP